MSSANPAATLATAPWRLLRSLVARNVLAVPQVVGPLVRPRADPVDGVSVRSAGTEVALDADALAAAFPHATDRLAVFVPSADEDESVWARHLDQVGGTYAGRLATLLDWTPLHLRVGARASGVEIAAALQALVEAWPTGVRRIALLGHGDGGLALRAACGVTNLAADPWHDLVSDVVLLDTPHLLAASGRELVPGARQLERDLAGVLTDDRVDPSLEPLPSARYTLVVPEARLRPSRLGGLVGGVLWWRHRVPLASALRPRRVRQLFPTADLRHVPTGEIGLANHPDVHQALITWLA